MIVSIKRLLDGHIHIEGMERYESRAGRRDEFNLGSCLEQNSKRPFMCCFMCYNCLHPWMVGNEMCMLHRKVPQRESCW